MISVLQPSFSKVFLALWWISSASHLQLDFFFGAGFRFDFTLLHFIGVCGAFFHRLKYGDFHTGLKTSFRKTLKYGENETNDIFTIDNTNVLKKNVHNLRFSFWTQNMMKIRNFKTFFSNWPKMLKSALCAPRWFPMCSGRSKYPWDILWARDKELRFFGHISAVLWQVSGCVRGSYYTTVGIKCQRD